MKFKVNDIIISRFPGNENIKYLIYKIYFGKYYLININDNIDEGSFHQEYIEEDYILAGPKKHKSLYSGHPKTKLFL